MICTCVSQFYLFGVVRNVLTPCKGIWWVNIVVNDWPLGFTDLQYKTCKDGSVLGVTVTRIALLTHCQALTQSCGYTEGEPNTNTHTYTDTVMLDLVLKSPFSDSHLVKLLFLFSAEIIVNVLDFKKDVGLWHGILTVSFWTNIM